MLEMVHPAQLSAPNAAAASPAAASVPLLPGQFEYDPVHSVLWVQCAPAPEHSGTQAPAPHTPRITSNRIAVRRLQIATRRPMSAADFANGFLRTNVLPPQDRCFT